MNDQSPDRKPGVIRRVLGAIGNAINAAGTLARNSVALVGVGVAIASGIVVFWEPIKEWFRRIEPITTEKLAQQPKTEPPLTTPPEDVPPPCASDASWLYAMLMAHKEKHPEREWTLDVLLRATVWGQSKCFVAELVYLPEYVSAGRYRPVLETTMWVGKELVSVRLNAYSQGAPEQFRRGAFIAITGELARVTRGAPNEYYVLTLENSTFSDKWSKALAPPSGEKPTAKH